jgi:hypothetical protein
MEELEGVMTEGSLLVDVLLPSLFGLTSKADGEAILIVMIINSNYVK